MEFQHPIDSYMIRETIVGLPRDVSYQNYWQGNEVGVHLNTYMLSRTRRTACEEQATYCESLKAFTPNTHLSICCSRLMAIPYHNSLKYDFWKLKFWRIKYAQNAC